MNAHMLCRFKVKSSVKTKKLDAWGHGTLKIITACGEAEAGKHEFEIREFAPDGMMLSFGKGQWRDESQSA